MKYLNFSHFSKMGLSEGTLWINNSNYFASEFQSEEGKEPIMVDVRRISFFRSFSVYFS